jgi:putative ABC transport system substrate-binding protein
LGWTDGHNVRIETRWGGGSASAIRKQAADVVALAPAVIFVHGTVTMTPLLEMTRTVPIVFVGITDPVGAGFIESLSRPGGNATGFTGIEYSLSGKWLELLKQVAPGVTRAAVLRDPAITAGTGQFGVTLLGGALATRPFTVRAEQPGMPVIGFLNGRIVGWVCCSGGGFQSGPQRRRLYRWPER